jgi:hypothetical protein
MHGMRGLGGADAPRLGSAFKLERATRACKLDEKPGCSEGRLSSSESKKAPGIRRVAREKISAFEESVDIGSGLRSGAGDSAAQYRTAKSEER